MAKDAQQLEIHVYLVDGEVYRFLVDDDAEMDRILQSSNPGMLFRQERRQVMIAGTYFMAGFANEAVTRIDYLTPKTPNWPHTSGIKEVIEVEERALERKALPRHADPRRTQADEPTMGGEVESFAEFGLRDGQRICLRLTSHIGSAIDQRSQIAQMFSGGTTGFHATRRGGGIIMINARNIVRWAMYPGPAKAPVNAWKGHRLQEQERIGGPPSLMFKKMDLSEDPSEEFLVVGGEDHRTASTQEIPLDDDTRPIPASGGQLPGPPPQRRDRRS